VRRTIILAAAQLEPDRMPKVAGNQTFLTKLQRFTALGGNHYAAPRLSVRRSAFRHGEIDSLP
jgi:hypothetical protein